MHNYLRICSRYLTGQRAEARLHRGGTSSARGMTAATCAQAQERLAALPPGQLSFLPPDVLRTIQVNTAAAFPHMPPMTSRCSRHLVVVQALPDC